MYEGRVCVCGVNVNRGGERKRLTIRTCWLTSQTVSSFSSQSKSASRAREQAREADELKMRLADSERSAAEGAALAAKRLDVEKSSVASLEARLRAAEERESSLLQAQPDDGFFTNAPAGEAAAERIKNLEASEKTEESTGKRATHNIH
jgi:hypothetical protein